MQHVRWNGCLLLVTLAAWGCGPSKLAVRPVRYEVDVKLTPRDHILDARVSVELARLDPDPPAKRRATVELLLHPDLELELVDAHGATVRSHKQRRSRPTEEFAVAPTKHRLVFERPGDRLHLTLRYHGRLYQDVAAGEQADQIHNFAVSAHVAEEGVFLAPDGYWYPQVELPADSEPSLMLSDYRLAVQHIDGFELVAGLERDDDSGDGTLRWSSPFPLISMVLLGGPLERASRRHGNIELHAVLAPGKESVAADILDASAEYLDRYEELVGPYPFKEFTVLEAFFSSGFAFPTCTQIAGSQLSEYKQYRRHGYLDHELLHNWWGNGILVDPRDGNWCEGLASYVGNYYGHVLDGDDDGARKQRRNNSNFLSSIVPADDLPLGTFGLDDGAGRGIGYQKASSVFHMLENKIGREAVFAGLRRLTAERMGKFSSWEHLQEAFEQESGFELDDFFEQWVRESGAPALELIGAEHRTGAATLMVTISQGLTDFVLDVPLRLHYGDRAADVVVTVDEPVETVELACEPHGLTAVELDPDYHLFRRLKPEEIMPTSILTRRSSELLIVAPAGDLPEGYQIVVDFYTKAVLEDEQGPKQGHQVDVRTADLVDTEDLSESSVLIVGDAVHHPTIREFLERTRSPVEWTAGAFSVEAEEYAEPGQAVFLTVHHPDLRDGGVTVYYGNSEAALSNARVLSYYPNSLLVFDTPEGESTGVESATEMPRAEVVRRMDFEFHDRINF